MKNILFLLIVFSSGLCYSQNSNQKATSNWVYKQDTDQMTSSLMHRAYTYSDKTVTIQGKLHYMVTLILENDRKGNVFIVQLTQKEFARKQSDSTIKIQMRFDTEQPEYYTFKLSTAVKPTFAYMDYKSAPKMIEKIKSTTKLILRFELTPDEMNTVTFNVAGLKWDYLK